MNDFATFDTLPFIPPHLLCTHFWQLLCRNELLPLLLTPHGHLTAFCLTFWRSAFIITLLVTAKLTDILKTKCKRNKLTKSHTHTHTHTHTRARARTRTRTRTRAHAHAHAHTHIHTRLTALFQGLPGWAGTRKVKAFYLSKRQWVAVASAGTYARSAPCSRQITTPAPHHSVFYRPVALPATQPTVSKH